MRKVERINAGSGGKVLQEHGLMPRTLINEHITILLLSGQKWDRVSRLHHTMGHRWKWEAKLAMFYKRNPGYLKSCSSTQQPWSDNFSLFRGKLS